jgi:NADPH:quinone reductase-like Zn-dependent oxidoreductase
MIQRQAYRIPKAGSLEYLKISQEELSDPAPGEVTVEIKTIGLNFADIFAVQGLYSATPEGSFVPGLEYAGTIIKTGEGVKDVKEGDKVMGVTRFGAYTSHLNIDHRYVVPLPDDWGFDEGASFLVQALTAYYALLPLGNLQNDQTVLIHSAAGGVGLMANRIAKKYNAYTLGTVGSGRKIDLLKKEGYDDAIIRDKDFADKLNRSLDGRPLNIVLECIGGDIFKDSFKAMAPMGRLITYGSASFTTHSDKPNYLEIFWKYMRRPKIDPIKLPTYNKSIMGFNLIWIYDQTEMMHRLLDELMSLDIGKPYVGQEFSFEQLPEAMRLFQSGQTMGKVVVRV